MIVRKSSRNLFLLNATNGGIILNVNCLVELLIERGREGSKIPPKANFISHPKWGNLEGREYFFHFWTYMPFNLITT
jgi:hypothetical protein